jgi:hypothetical protein
MAVFGDHNHGTPFGALSPSGFFNADGKGRYSYSGFSSRDGRKGFPEDATVVITSPSTGHGKVGIEFYYAITTSGYGDVSLMVSGMPSWMTQNGNVLGGVPTTDGTFELTISASNNESSDNKTVAVSIADAASPQIYSSLTAAGVVGFSLEYAIIASGNPRTYKASNLPDGITLDGPTLVGTPEAAGVYNIGLEVWDEFGGSSAETLVLTVAASHQAEINNFAGTPGSGGFLGDTGLATSARLQSPYGVTSDSAGNVYIADRVNNRIRKVDLAGNITTVVGGGTFVPPNVGDGGLATLAELLRPEKVVVDSLGNMYISDSMHHRIRRVDAGTSIITTICGDGTGDYSGDDGPATAAQINSPAGLSLSTDESVLYFADRGNARIRKIDLNTGVITLAAGNGGIGFTGDGTSAIGASLGNPEDVLVTADGFYIADYLNNRVRFVDADGIITTIAGIGTMGHTGDGGPATAAKVTLPAGLAIDSAGNLFIAEGNHYIRRVDARTGVISTFAGLGSSGFAGNGGPAPLANVSSPKGLWMSPDDSLYVADAGSHSVRKIDSLSPISISLVSPSSGSASGGFMVTVTGHNFSPSTKVLFGGKSWVEGSTTYVSPTQLAAVVPALPAFAYPGELVSVAVQGSPGWVEHGAIEFPAPVNVLGFAGSFGDAEEFCGVDGVAFLPWKPTLTFPINYAVLVGPVKIDWQAPDLVDPCGGPASFEIQFTRTLSKNSGWRTIASELPSSQRSFLFDVSNVPYTTDGGIRIRSKNSRNLYSDFSQSVQAFTIGNHAPNALTLIAPIPGDVVDNNLLVTWKLPVVNDIDGHVVTYRIEVTEKASQDTGWTVVPGAEEIPEGETAILLDSTEFPEGEDYGLRIVAVDELGAESAYSVTRGFTVRHTGVFVIDTLPPVGTMTINEGAPLTKSTRVTLNLFAYDAGTGIKDVRFRNSDEDCWSDFDTFVGQKSWNLTAVDGVKKVFVQYRDYAGNVSEACDCEIISRVLCGAGNVTDIEVFNNRLYAAFDRNGNLLEYKVLVREAAALPQPEVTALARFGNSLYVSTYDPDSSQSRVYRYDGTAVQVLSISGTKVLSMVAYNSLLYIGLQDGTISAFTGTSSSTSYVASSAVTRLRTDGTVLYASLRGGSQYLSFDGTTWKVNSL